MAKYWANLYHSHTQFPTRLPPRTCTGSVNGVGISSSGAYIVTCGADRRLCMWSLEGENLCDIERQLVYTYVRKCMYSVYTYVRKCLYSSVLLSLCSVSMPPFLNSAHNERLAV